MQCNALSDSPRKKKERMKWIDITRAKEEERFLLITHYSVGAEVGVE